MEPISATSSAISGMTAARLQMEMAAAVLARVLPGPSSGGAADVAAVSSSPDIAAALVEQMLAVRMFGMNVNVARTADELTAETMRLADGLSAG